jgi:hypothetical protein
LLQNELIGGNEILDQLAELVNMDNLRSFGEAEQLEKDFRQTCAKARQAWALAVFSDAGEQTLRRYFTFHVQVITALSKRVSSWTPHVFAYNGVEENEKWQQCVQGELLGLLDHLREYFARYPEKDLLLPVAYGRHTAGLWREQGNLLLEMLDQVLWDNSLKESLGAYIRHMLRSDDRTRLTFDQVHYFQRFLNELLPVVAQIDAVNGDQLVSDKLLELNFNQLEVFTFQQDRIRMMIKGRLPAAQLTILKNQVLVLSNVKTWHEATYDTRLPSLQAMLTAWLHEEINSKQGKPAGVPVTDPPLNFKLTLQLSVAQLACIIKLFYRAGIYGDTPLTDIFKFTAQHFCTKRQPAMSWQSLSKEYYGLDLVNAGRVRILLKQMITYINEHFFPVMAAIGVVIGAY